MARTKRELLSQKRIIRMIHNKLRISLNCECTWYIDLSKSSSRFWNRC